MTATILLASDHLDKARAEVVVASPGVAVALTPGEGPSRNSKDQPNEDSVAAVAIPGGVLAVVADSHWGAKAGEMAARALAGSADAVSPDPQGLEKAMLDLDEEIVRRKPSGDESETTVLAAAVLGRKVAWASVGDSQLWAVSRGAARRVNDDRHVFAGGRSLAKRRIVFETPSLFVESGELELAEGEVLLLASDGLSPEDSGIGPEEIPGILLGDGPLEARVRALVDRARSASAGGGRDNVALVVVDPALSAPG